jgi:Fe2+ transport system protein FeoA
MALDQTSRNRKPIPLSMLRPGEKGELIEIRCPHKTRHRLADLGLNCGDCIHVISGECKGAMILGYKRDARLAVGRGMAHQILVRIADK